MKSSDQNFGKKVTEMSCQEIHSMSLHSMGHNFFAVDQE